ncbi:DNA-binding transcriptional regulator, MarR family [Granulicatella balaenopterae]|uniref:DNA-binding transcriptional regulator, MarR family n=1 Tax=Granulicatella balaenopterae TaxID=137733 RepID=A0A1H9MC91_9LACT|nr:MarR family transcriptional regulator [Granulicatella balaenopterae]SER21316.1 DNA-binding transcriptional regulator, MarR family [Granulicatella balaenopterae]
MFRLEDCISFVTNRSAKEMSDELERRLAPYHVTRAQWTTLYYIRINSQISQKKLASLLSIKESSVVRQLDKMEKAGWIKRVTCSTDRRTKCLSLTDTGLQIELEMEEVVSDFKNAVVEDIPEEDLTVFKNVLQKMLDNVID